MDIEGDFAAFQISIQAALVATTRIISQIATQDIDFHRSLDPSVATSLDRQNARLLSISERLLANANASSDAVGSIHLPDFDAIDTNWRGIVDAVDSLLEKADISIDEYTGAVKRLSPSRDQTPIRPTPSSRSFKDRDLPKPQRLFHHPPDTADRQPFKPLLETKPHAANSSANTLKLDSNDHYPHPYKEEIQQYRYPAFVHTRAEPIPYLDFDPTTATIVDTEDGVFEMLQELKQAKEIAIDLEHHDQRSYVGLVSLMQISTRNKDWIVDTLKPWRRKLQCLNEVFADPAILKVLHGAHMDIVWLQRDLGLYIVGLFDTHHASRVLKYQGGSLAFLLKKFADVDAQKQYQTADWRIRPLPQELFDYARSDTHYLLYIYDNMRNELIQESHLELPDHTGDLVNEVLNRSKMTALQTYRNDVYDAERGLGARGWYGFVERTPALLDKVQFAVFRAVHKWRDDVAREQDDGLHFVMPNWTMFSLAREMPSTKAALFGICQPMSESLRLRADELLAIIQKAKEQGQEAREMFEIIRDIHVHLHGEPEPEPELEQTVTTKVAETHALPDPSSSTSHTPGVRASLSRFWGSMLGKISPQKQQKRFQSSTTAPSLSVPLPSLTAEIFTSTNNNESPAESLPPAPVVSSSEKEEEEVFTLKQLNHKKRKSDHLTRDDEGQDSLASNADELFLDSRTTDPEREARRVTKRGRKEAKRAAAARSDAEKSQPSPNPADEQEEAFDYSTAASVYNPPTTMTENGRKKKKNKDDNKAEFNPYVKALDAPKGLPRAHREKAGKTKTFKR